MALTHALAYRSSPVDRPRLCQADEPLVPVQFPDETAVADARVVVHVDETPGDERRTSAPKWIEVPVDRIAEPQGAIGEQVEMTLQQVVGLARGDPAVIRQPCIERRGCRVPIDAGKEALWRDLAQDAKRRVRVGERWRVLPEQHVGSVRQIPSAPRVPAIWRLPASRDRPVPRHGYRRFGDVRARGVRTGEPRSGGSREEPCCPLDMRCSRECSAQFAGRAAYPRAPRSLGAATRKCRALSPTGHGARVGADARGRADGGRPRLRAIEEAPTPELERENRPELKIEVPPSIVRSKQPIDVPRTRRCHAGGTCPTTG